MSDKKRIRVAIALVFRDGLLLVSRRRAGDHLGGFWEFPGGKITEGESAARCAEREVLEEVGVLVKARGERAPIAYDYPDRHVTLYPVDCDWVRGEPLAREVAEVHWVTLAELLALNLPPANAPLLEALRSEPKLVQLPIGRQ